MNFDKVIKLAHLFQLKVAQMPEKDIRNVADLLNKRRKKVPASGIYFEGQSKGELVPVFIVDEGTKVNGNPAVGVRFGNFAENPYQSDSERVDYVNKLLGSLASEYKVFTPSFTDTVTNTVRNRTYSSYVLVTLK